MGSEESSRDRRQRVQSASLGAQILIGLTELGGRASLTALAAHCQLSTAKAHRYVSSLLEAGLFSQDELSQQYFLGPKSIRVGVVAMRQSDPIRLAEASLHRLRTELEISCFIAIMGSAGPTIMRFEEPMLPVTVNVRAGSVMSLVWSATGRVFIGLSTDKRLLEQARQEFNATAQIHKRADQHWDQELAQIRSQLEQESCATVRDLNLPGISAVAAPVFDHTGRLVAVLTALGTTGGFDINTQGETARAVVHEAGLLSELMGYESLGPSSLKR